MSQPFIGEVRAIGFTYAPKGWALCNGQLLSIAQNQALFAILGTTYGGNGIQTFGLPDLRGRTPVGAGKSIQLGESSGEATHALLPTEIPTHVHGLVGSTADGVGDATNQVPAAAKMYVAAGGALAPMDPSMIAPAGSSQPHQNMQPYLVLNFAIALTGIFPSHS
jgi:microcystin-dependent protein